jgi:hypothetical protein
VNEDVNQQPFDVPDDERAEAKRAEEERRQREIEENDLRHVLNSKQGRRFVWRQLSAAGIYNLSFSTDTATMAFNEGGRNRGLTLLAEIMRTCPERYTDMLVEQRNRKTK